MSLIELLSEKSDGAAVVGRVCGVVSAIVSNAADPDGLGRVKLKYPWLKDDSESPWARLMSFMAGADRGAVFRPEVGDEVLVMFEHGDMRFPYVLGAVWNGKDAMPSERKSDSDNAVRLIKSRSGHLIVFDDSAGSEKVTITDKAGNSIEMSSAGLVVKSANIKLGSDGASQALVLGTAFMDLFNNHTHPTGVGPSGPPVQPMMSGNHVSSKHMTE
jgi:uncharacterized protein involved in type VI secretion and phage assembly